MSSIFELPTFASFLIFVSLSAVFSIMALYIFKTTIREKLGCGTAGATFFIYVSILAVFLSTLISFIIVTVWTGYNNAELQSETEAQAIYNLYQNLYNLPDTKKEQILIISYLEYIINVEFPSLNSGVYIDLEPGLKILQELQKEIYSYVPKNKQEAVLYDNSISSINLLLQERIFRLENSRSGLNNILWVVTLIDSILIFLMCLIVYCGGHLHYFLVLVLSIYFSSSFYIIWGYVYPYRGYSGIKPTAFQDALENIKTNNLKK